MKDHFKISVWGKSVKEVKGTPTVSNVQLRATKLIFQPFLLRQFEFSPKKGIVYKKTNNPPKITIPLVIIVRVKNNPKVTTALDTDKTMIPVDIFLVDLERTSG